jgi:hypothetical protein
MNLRKRSPHTVKQLDALIEAAVVDAYGEAEQAVGFLTMMEEHLAFPFAAAVLGQPVTVTSVDISRANQIVAVCERGRLKQRIPILELGLAVERPAGVEWVDAYRRWCGER